MPTNLYIPGGVYDFAFILLFQVSDLSSRVSSSLEFHFLLFANRHHESWKHFTIWDPLNNLSNSRALEVFVMIHMGKLSKPSTVVGIRKSRFGTRLYLPRIHPWMNMVKVIILRSCPGELCRSKVLKVFPDKLSILWLDSIGCIQIYPERRPGTSTRYKSREKWTWDRVT